MADFELVGGVRKPSTHKLEKFLLFFVIDGLEYPIYECLKTGVVLKKTEHGHEYQTGLRYAKLFVYESGFGYGVQRRFHSFYFRLKDEGDLVTIRPFAGLESPYFLRSKLTFLNKKEVLKMLSDQNQSKRYVKMQDQLSVEALRAMIEVERSIPKDVRHIKIGGKQNLGGI